MRWLVGGFFMLHGLGHAMGFGEAWTKLDMGFADRSWIFGDAMVESGVGRAWGVLWLIALVAWVAVGLGVFSRAEWWEALALSAAVVSLVAIVPWWNAVPVGARLGALVDVVVIVGLLVPAGRRLADSIA